METSPSHSTWREGLTAVQVCLCLNVRTLGGYVVHCWKLYAMFFRHLNVCVCVTKRIEAVSIFYGPAHSEHLAYLQHIDKERVQPFTTSCVCMFLCTYAASLSVC